MKHVDQVWKFQEAFNKYNCTFVCLMTWLIWLTASGFTSNEFTGAWSYFALPPSCSNEIVQIYDLGYT